MEGQQCQFGWGREEGGWRKGPWTAQEDKLLVEYVRQHGEGRWNSVAKITGLKRSGKSCRLRWVNYLRPDLKRGKITPQEESLILELHALWGNRWSTIARSLPGRTDNEIKNYWRTHFKKGKPSKNIERARARFLKQRREMQQQQQSQLHLQAQQQQVEEEEEEEELDDEDDASAEDTASAAGHAGETAPAAAQPPHDGDDDFVDGLTMQGMPDVDMDEFLYHPIDPAYFFDGGGASTSEAGSSEEVIIADGGGAATWGSLWNLDDVVDDVDGAGGVCCWGSACSSFPPLPLQDQGLAFH